MRSLWTLMVLLAVTLMGCPSGGSMNYGELRASVVQETGDYSLVGTQVVGDETLPDYSVDGAYMTGALERYINEAVKTLTNRLNWHTSDRTVKLDVFKGQYLIPVPNLRTLDKRGVVWVDGDKTGVIKKPLDWMERHYFSDDVIDFSDVEVGTPSRMTRVLLNRIDEEGDEAIVDGGLNDATNWGNNAAVSGGVATFADANYVLFPTVALDLPAGVHRFRADTTVISGTPKVWIHFFGPPTIPIVGTSPTESDAIAVTNDGIEADVTLYEDGPQTLVIFVVQTSGDSFTMDNISLVPITEYEIATDGSGDTTGILLLPPADNSYTLKIRGRFYPQYLTSTLDSNWVTDNLSGVVISYASEEWAKGKGDSILAAFHRANAERKLQETYKDKVDDELKSYENEDGIIMLDRY